MSDAFNIMTVCLVNTSHLCYCITHTHSNTLTWDDASDVAYKVEVGISSVSTTHGSQHPGTATLSRQVNVTTHV